ncbi:phage holin family protein [Paenibacillus melissococcoides]|uniref:Phage holin family protein n=1 Tax=Paenibacillus melissococcoides TaxID=2912268 RepID=A0ABM9G674_9BACL|nr:MULTISPECIES: phage holin family protein [Paenibacillus]MEB9897983.1 phage holin family protein [Bacillus cereus]CAH8242824.1 phage holin family protein [Paenibacillus melissococcoides]CAH8245134.1 phage holin family protein [Paenibacillus melissococcoides]CAH8246878.1 phage holin family protein [Paenibacillus melissococcoides]CAH8248854.1 phage holin family protein [Paenibacillus melissococcoides]
MEWQMIFELIDPALFVVVGACWVIGYMLKQTPPVPDWSIVYIVVVLAVVFTVGTLGWSVEAIIQGILAGAFAVFGHQAVKQMKKGGEK